jgi:hypothetical protein
VKRRTPLVGATETRRSLGLSESEPIDIFRVLRYVEEISIVRCPFGDSSSMSGLFVKKCGVRLMVINTERSWGHQIFTAAHELYHVKYNEGMSGSLCHVATVSAIPTGASLPSFEKLWSFQRFRYRTMRRNCFLS